MYSIRAVWSSRPHPHASARRGALRWRAAAVERPDDDQAASQRSGSSDGQHPVGAPASSSRARRARVAPSPAEARCRTALDQRGKRPGPARHRGRRTVQRGAPCRRASAGRPRAARGAGERGRPRKPMPTALTKAAAVSPAVRASAATASGHGDVAGGVAEAAPCSRLWNRSHSLDEAVERRQGGDRQRADHEDAAALAACGARGRRAGRGRGCRSPAGRTRRREKGSP